MSSNQSIYIKKEIIYQIEIYTFTKLNAKKEKKRKWFFIIMKRKLLITQIKGTYMYYNRNHIPLFYFIKR